MSTTEFKSPPATPGTWHLWVVGLVSLVWNAGSCYSQVMVLTHNERYFRAGQMTPEMVEYFTTRPLLYDLAANVSVWGGVVAAIGLLMRKSWTVPWVVVSQAAMGLNCIYTLVSPDANKALGAKGSIPAIILVVLGALLVVYTIKMKRHGLLR
jgi:hypothetical protein